MPKKISAEEFLKKLGYETEEERRKAEEKIFEAKKKRLIELKAKGEFPPFNNVSYEFEESLVLSNYCSKNQVKNREPLYCAVILTPEQMIEFCDYYSQDLVYSALIDSAYLTGDEFLYINFYDKDYTEFISFVGLASFVSSSSNIEFLENRDALAFEVGMDNLNMRNFVSVPTGTVNYKKEIKNGSIKLLNISELSEMIYNRMKSLNFIKEPIKSKISHKRDDILDNNTRNCLSLIRSLDKSSNQDVMDKTKCLAIVSEYYEINMVLDGLFAALLRDIRGEVAIIAAAALSHIIEEKIVQEKLFKEFTENKNRKLMGGQNPQNRILYSIALSKNRKLLDELNPDDFSDNLSPDMENKRNNLIESAKNFDLDGIADNLIWLEALDYAANKNVFIYASEIFPSNSVLFKKLVNRLN